MSITISKFDDQSRGYADGGKIKERKGVYFESEVKGVSNLFYWAYVWSDEGGIVEEHAHKGFEIITYVLDGEVELKNSDSEEWEKHAKGGMDVTRAGNGFSHSEKFHPGTKVLQIWMDPDFRRSLQRPVASTEYEADEFEYESFNGMNRIDFCGDEAPTYFASPLQMDRYDFNKGSFNIPIPKNQIFTAVVIGGELTVNGEKMEEGDLIRLESESAMEFEAAGEGSLFSVVVPTEPGYRTYTDQLQMSS